MGCKRNREKIAEIKYNFPGMVINENMFEIITYDKYYKDFVVREVSINKVINKDGCINACYIYKEGSFWTPAAYEEFCRREKLKKPVDRSKISSLYHDNASIIKAMWFHAREARGRTGVRCKKLG